MSGVDLFATIIYSIMLIGISIFSFKVHIIFLLFNIPIWFILFFHIKEILFDYKYYKKDGNKKIKLTDGDEQPSMSSLN